MMKHSIKCLRTKLYLKNFMDDSGHSGFENSIILDRFTLYSRSADLNMVHRQCMVISLDATEYHDIVDWQTYPMTKFPVMIYFTDNELKDTIPAQIAQSVLFFRLLCHTQVERWAKPLCCARRLAIDFFGLASLFGSL